jgi:hypothetical protein
MTRLPRRLDVNQHAKGRPLLLLVHRKGANLDALGRAATAQRRNTPK